MNYNYTFKQAHQDRLEDAGVKQYRPADGFNVLKGKRDDSKRSVAQGLRPILATIINLIAR